MPTVEIKFNLPEEIGEFEMTSAAGKLFSVLWDLKEILRSKRKYSTEDPKEYLEAWEWVEGEINTLIDEEGLNSLFS